MCKKWFLQKDDVWSHYQKYQSVVFKLKKDDCSWPAKTQKVIIPDINHLSDEEQVEIIAEHFSQIPNE